jgi:hypothetical protein
MAVALAASYSVNSVSNTANQTITTGNFKPTTGDSVVVKVVTSDTAAPIGSPVASAGGITWVKRTENTIASTNYAVIWTGTVTSGGTIMTISVTATGGITVQLSMVVERWTGAQLSAMPSLIQAEGTASVPSANITIMGTGSVISWLNGDRVGVVGTATYSNGATQDGIHQVGSGTAYAAYYAYQTAVAGLNNIAMSTPTGQTWILMAIEIQVTGQVNPGPSMMMTTGVGN